MINPCHLSDSPAAKRIAFATIGDPSEVRFWSGTPFHMSKSLASEGHEVVHVGPLSAPILPLYKMYSRLRRTFRRRSLSPFHAEPVVAQYAADAARKIRAVSPDVVFAPAGSTFAWNVPEGVPLVYASDATFRLIENYHPNYRNLSRTAREIAERLERNTIARADLVLYPSEWAAESAGSGLRRRPCAGACHPLGRQPRRSAGSCLCAWMPQAGSVPAPFHRCQLGRERRGHRGRDSR